MPRRSRKDNEVSDEEERDNQEEQKEDEQQPRPHNSADRNNKEKKEDNSSDEEGNNNRGNDDYGEELPRDDGSTHVFDFTQIAQHMNGEVNTQSLGSSYYDSDINDKVKSIALLLRPSKLPASVPWKAIDPIEVEVQRRHGPFTVHRWERGMDQGDDKKEIIEHWFCDADYELCAVVQRGGAWLMVQCQGAHPAVETPWFVFGNSDGSSDAEPCDLSSAESCIKSIVNLGWSFIQEQIH